MKRLLLFSSIAMCVPLLVFTQTKADNPNEVTRQNDHDAIIEAISSYLDAYNAKDAKALAKHWSANGQWINQETGERIQGRQAIEQQFSKMLKDSELKMDVTVQSIHFVTEMVAVEDGIATIKGPEGVSESGYTAIHVKENGKWKLDNVRENALPTAKPATAPHPELQQLEWMIGQWVDQSEDVTIETNCEWVANRKFLTRSFNVMINGQLDLAGTQVIGWDAQNGFIRSWVFDTEGGFGQGQWTRKGGTWEIHSQQTLSDGGSAASTNIIRYVDKDNFAWKSIGRKVNGKFVPNIDEVNVTRKK